eukprot:154269-Chlamydomonas_euryale.AAC.3
MPALLTLPSHTSQVRRPHALLAGNLSTPSPPGLSSDALPAAPPSGVLRAQRHAKRLPPAAPHPTPSARSNITRRSSACATTCRAAPQSARSWRARSAAAPWTSASRSCRCTRSARCAAPMTSGSLTATLSRSSRTLARSTRRSTSTRCRRPTCSARLMTFRASTQATAAHHASRRTPAWPSPASEALRKPSPASGAPRKPSRQAEARSSEVQAQLQPSGQERQQPSSQERCSGAAQLCAQVLRRRSSCRRLGGCKCRSVRPSTRPHSVCTSIPRPGAACWWHGGCAGSQGLGRVG